MTITERVMGLGDWSLRLAESTPPSVLAEIAVPFSTIVVTPARLTPSTLPDAAILGSALYSGVVLRPGPQRELGGRGIAWFLGDEKGGSGVAESGLTFSAMGNGTAVTGILAGTAFTVGNVTDLNAYTAKHGLIDRRTVLTLLAANSGYEWKVNPSFTFDLGPVATLYGTDPTGIIVRRDGGRELASPQGITGQVFSTWDWSQYGSKAYVWSKQGSGSSGGASPYYDPQGNSLTIVRGFEEPDAPSQSETTIAAWWLGRIDRTVRTVEITTENYGVTGSVPCGGQVWLFDPDQGLYDPANQVPFQGQILAPVSARVQSVTWPVKQGMGVYFRYHDGSTANYVDLTDYIEWESGDARYEISTSAQSLAPPTTSPGLSTYFSPWAPWVPQWQSILGPASDPAIGNGSLGGTYRRLGTTLDFTLLLDTGTTTTFGTGGWKFTLPPGCSAPTSSFNLITSVYLNGIGVGSFEASAIVAGGGTELTLLYGSGGVDATTPINWSLTSAGSTITINGTMEVQP